MHGVSKEEVVGEGRYERSLALLDNYLKRAAYGSGGADSLTIGTPVALYRLDNSYNVVNQHQGVTLAHTDTQATLVTLSLVY